MIVAEQAKSRIAFGACNEQDMVNNLWPIIEERDASAFIWGGDAIYAGTNAGNKPYIYQSCFLGYLTPHFSL